MSTISISGVGTTGCYWKIDSLSYLWDTDQYNYAYVTFNGVASASIYPPPSPGYLYNTPVTLYSSLSAGTTYSAIGYLSTPSGLYATTNTFSFSTRPYPFSWSLSKASGAQLQISAAEISELQNNINGVRSYRNIAPYYFTSWSVGATGNSVALWLEIYNSLASLNPPQVMQVPNTSTVISNSSFFSSVLNSVNSVT